MDKQYKLVPVEILDRFPELNMSNYGPDDVDALNAWGIELVLAAAPAKPLDRDAIRNALLEEVAIECEKWSENPDISENARDNLYGFAHCYVREQMKSQPAKSVENEAEILLDWLIRQVSGQEFRRIGIEYSAGCTIDDIKQAMKSAKPSDSQAEVSDTEITDKVVKAAMTEWMEDKDRTLFESMRAAIKAAMRAQEGK